MSESAPLEANDGAQASGAVVYVSDPSVEAERVAQALRSAGFTVVDVPLAMLVARVAVQRPEVVLLDADADGAMETASRLHELDGAAPDSPPVDVLFLGEPGAGLTGVDDALAHEASGFFPRPVDVPALVRKISSLTDAHAQAHARGDGAPPPGSAPPPPASAPSAASPGVHVASPGAAGLPPASMRGREPSSSRPPPSRHPLPAIPSGSLRPIPVPAESSAFMSASHGHGLSQAYSGARGPRGIGSALSAEVEALLHEAEQRVGEQLLPDAMAPTPDEEIEAVLPAEILASLDEPLEEEDLEEAMNESLAMPRPASTGGRLSPSAAGSGRFPSRRPASLTPFPAADIASLTPGPAKTHGGPLGSTTTGAHGVATGLPTLGALDGGTPGARLITAPPPTASAIAPMPYIDAHSHEPRVVESIRAGGPPPLHIARLLGNAPHAPPSTPAPVASVSPAVKAAATAAAVNPPAVSPSVLGAGDAPRTLGNAIASRVTGALAFTGGETVRRVVLRDGDIVTCASSDDDEGLLAFLGARGDLPREALRRLAGKVPPFGRHAGAALIAHGYLRQDQLWDVLRAHAEWVLGHVFQLATGVALLEDDPPGRLRSEPGVFNAATGAAVFLEVARRVIGHDDAVARLGGGASRVGDGPRPELLAECALDATEIELVAKARARTIDDIAAAAPTSDIATVLYGLALLGVVEAIRAVGLPAAAASGPAADVDALDEEAIRARVRARLQLVDEGDYFAILGVAPEATGYEVRRAFLELRRAFEPARILTPQVADLADDVRRIASVIEEAYEILHDTARRERYRRAIGA